MMMLGIIGEYLWRVLEEVKYQPLYSVNDFQPPGPQHAPPSET